MRGIQLTIVSPDGVLYDGAADSVRVRTVTGDVGITGEHTNYFSVIDAAGCAVSSAGEVRHAACSDGYLTVKHGTEVRLVCTTFEWAEDIDAARAEAAYARADALLADPSLSDAERARHRAKRRRAAVRIHAKAARG